MTSFLHEPSVRQVAPEVSTRSGAGYGNYRGAMLLCGANGKLDGSVQITGIQLASTQAGGIEFEGAPDVLDPMSQGWHQVELAIAQPHLSRDVDGSIGLPKPNPQA